MGNDARHCDDGETKGGADREQMGTRWRLGCVAGVGDDRLLAGAAFIDS
jgi:hypothetical protein